MSGPVWEGSRFLRACLLGLALGCFYGFLRPLRRRHPYLADVMFLPAAFYAWLYLGFAVCGGDIRLGYTAGLAAGAFFWECTVGKWLRPVFSGFWQVIFRILEGIFRLFQKIFKKIRKK